MQESRPHNSTGKHGEVAETSTFSLLSYPSNFTAHSSRWPLPPGRATRPDCTTTRRKVLKGSDPPPCRAAAALAGTSPLRTGSACSHNLHQITTPPWHKKKVPISTPRRQRSLEYPACLLELLRESAACMPGASRTAGSRWAMLARQLRTVCLLFQDASWVRL
jgi:hypothetical protein